MPAIPERDGLLSHGRDASGPARRAATVTPSDASDLPNYAKALYVGAAGNVRVLPTGAQDAEAVTFANHPVGWLPVQVRRVLATGTTAAQIVAVFD
ncbi:spike base protein, RCAP_Rcc01079 family [Brevundimonas nasdae]|uniref:Uncharacterized protein n=1 Tax=Brevundimonas nasdae TaxID=172043 RepID=A0ABX8TIS8_9CAUL|nr:hypothetical protein [Brevundimonas nasdae]QYC09059.1 hypothetical protein KWG56_10470 [Brevundimonas nasdae]QYC15109.1 hypothetical protein KWG63_05805 [Brevundimonas nasdae]